MRLFWPSRTLRAATSSKTPEWSKTLHLPKSTFPARPSAGKLEEYRQRCADDLYEWQRANRPQTVQDKHGRTISNEFILHDGPPYANGAVHVGHALNKILKDLILRTELSQGRRVHYQPGWDCHGLPIELKALQQRKAPTSQAKALKDAPAAEHIAAAKSVALRDTEVRQAARELATKTVEEQKKEFRQWAVMGEWDTPYRTMDKDFELRQLQIFREMVKNDLIFRDYRPVYWSPSSRTALAESELEYDDKHKCTAAFVKMPLVDTRGMLSGLIRSDEPIYAVIWTTTPWTLPANKAIAVKSDMQYSLTRLEDPAGRTESGLYIIGSTRIDHVQSFLPEGWTLTPTGTEISGDTLSSSTKGYHSVFSGETAPIVCADFVTDASGTGLVHIAPGHGMDDYQLCLLKGISPAFAPVNDAGQYTIEVAPALVDQSVLPDLKVETDGTKAILAILQKPADNFTNHTATDTLLLAEHVFTHKNPIDWRTKKPVIVRSTAQWFADVSRINARALESLENVDFIPATGKNRLTSFVQGRSQWCISRQRAWGVPIPVIYHKETDKENASDDVTQHIISTIAQRGTDAWFTDAPDDPAWLPPSLDPAEWVRKRDTMDVWFDSGTSWTSIKARDGQQFSDVYLEGSDQHRGWFQSSLLTKIATQDSGTSPTAPYKKLITHGFTLDADGRKMSKSIGNVISPMEIITGSIFANQSGSKKKKQDSLGPDLLRLWVASCDYTKDVTVSQQAIQTMQQALHKYRVTFKFLLGVLQNSSPTALDYAECPTYDLLILDLLENASARIHSAYKEYRFFDGVREVNHFMNTDLSAFYFEIVKDTLYTGLGADRLRTQRVLSTILNELLQWLSPLTPYLVEEVWEHASNIGTTYPLHQEWLEPYTLPPSAPHISTSAMEVFSAISKAVKAAQEKARTDGKIGSGLACAVELSVKQSVLDEHFWSLQHLRNALVVSELRIADVTTDISPPAWVYEENIDNPAFVPSSKIRVLPPTLEKCPRCWQYNSQSQDALCSRCEEAVSQQSS
ncbi:hypothetical protein AMS68_003323 [Peltaster fructicola]|uniref:isoleucine--tRNA ligase n=1 Tax=Peltaster fructicola TaxID=286661 RepID=A0A6H0XT04_9PEZI|nr:hypothetical protein AMS68_003323 [Peltaster fructicola]